MVIIMDLNKAMVGIYKENSMRRRNQKHIPKEQETKNNQPATCDPDDSISSETKKLRLDDSLAVLPKATFDKLFGFGEIINELKGIVNRFNHDIKNNVKSSNFPILVCGSKSLGKTSLIEAAANYGELKLIVIPFRKFKKLSKNELDVKLRICISHCKLNKPAIVLFDDIDAILEKEGSKDLVLDTIQELIKDDTPLLPFCTASNSSDIESSITLLQTIHLKRPDTESRCRILKNQSNPFNLNDDELRMLAVDTPSFTALDLEVMHEIARSKFFGGNSNILNCYMLAIKIVKGSLRRGTHLIAERPTTTWDDIGGLPQVRDAFSDMLRDIKIGNIDCQNAGIILYGPPGCGKTMVARAMANEAGLNFISVKGPELLDKFLGETEKNIRNVFREAKEYEPCMIYFDEFDGLCKKRGDRDNVTNAIQALLGEMDGFEDRGKSIILASTNRLQDLDPAIKRSGRLSTHIFVGLPDNVARLEILRKLTKKFRLSSDIDLVDWANTRTKEFTGADLAHLIAKAKNQATRKILQEDLNKCGEPVNLMLDHMEKALDEIKKYIHSSKELL